MADFVTDPRFVTKFKNLMVSELITFHNFDHINAVYEVRMMLERVGISKLVENSRLNYFRMPRNGSTIALTRAERAKIVDRIDLNIELAKIDRHYR